MSKCVCLSPLEGCDLMFSSHSKDGDKEGKSERQERQQAVDTLRCYNRFQGPSVFPAFYIWSLLLVLYGEILTAWTRGSRWHCPVHKASYLILSTQLRHLSYILMSWVTIWRSFSFSSDGESGAMGSRRGHLAMGQATVWRGA